MASKTGRIQTTGRFGAMGHAVTYGLGLITFCPRPAPPKEAMTCEEDFEIRVERKKCRLWVDLGMLAEMRVKCLVE